MRIVFAVIVVLVVIAAIAGIATQAYNRGVAQGLAESGKVPAPPAGAPYPYYGFIYHGPFGFGFFGLVFPLLFLFLLFGLFRGLLFRGHWGGPHRHWGKGVPPAFEEWHRRAHESQGEAGSRSA